jgi:hypothetical protein
MDTAPTSADGRLRMADLEAEDRYHRERYALYRAKTYGPRPTSPARLRKLRLASEAAESRLRRARELADPTPPAR